MAFLFAIILFVGAWGGAEIVFDRFEVGSDDTPIRLGIWRSGIQMVADYPLLGMGGGSWRFAWAQYRGADVCPTETHHHFTFGTSDSFNPRLGSFQGPGSGQLD